MKVICKKCNIDLALGSIIEEGHERDVAIRMVDEHEKMHRMENYEID